jgi:hypothetical protein
VRLVLLIAALMLVALVLFAAPWSVGVSAGDAERLLRSQYVGDARSIDCRRTSSVDWLPVEDADYECTVENAWGGSLRWWVATDRDGIVAADPEGP